MTFCNKDMGGFRELDAKEIEAVSGGFGEVDDNIIIVNGVRSEPIDFGGAFTFGPPEGYVGDLAYDFGEGGTPPFAENMEHECETDRNIDSLAQQVADMIRSQSDSNAREYGAVIYYDTSGNLKMGTLTPGQTVAEAISAGLGAPETRLSVPSDLGLGGIVAVVHSHPDIGYNNSEDIQNRYPSNNPGSNGDYQTFNALVGSSGFGNSAIFAQYILGPDGVLREFNASEGIVTASTDSNPSDRENLSSDRSTCNNESS